MGTPHISTTFTCSGGGGERNPSPRLGDEEVAARRRGQDRHHWGVKNQGPGRTAGGRIKASSRREPPRKLCLAGSFVKLRRKRAGVWRDKRGSRGFFQHRYPVLRGGARQPVACPSGGTWKMRISRPPPAPAVPLTSTSPPWFPPGPVATLSTLSFLLPSHSSLFLSPVIAFPSPRYTHKDPSRKAR